MEGREGGRGGAEAVHSSAREMQLSWALLWPGRAPDPRLNEPGSGSMRCGQWEG